MEYYILQMEINILDYLRMVKKMEKEYYIMQMEADIKDYLRKIKRKEKGNNIYLIFL